MYWMPWKLVNILRFIHILSLTCSYTDETKIEIKCIEYKECEIGFYLVSEDK